MEITQMALEPHDAPASWAPVAILVRELRKPIGAIRSAISVMEAAKDLPGAMDRARRLVTRQIGQLSVLMDGLLEMDNLARGSLRLQRDWIDFVSEVQTAIEGCSWALEGFQQSVCLEVPDRPLYAYLDPMRLRQVLTNLLDNACEYAEAWGRVTVRIEQIGEEVVMSVSAKVAGSSPDRLAHGIDRFSLAGVGGESQSIRTGIGLAVVRELVQLHGGAVEAQCAGTTVVRWPLGRPRLLTQIP
jgi:signal transduction histidine kinase